MQGGFLVGEGFCIKKNKLVLKCISKYISWVPLRGWKTTFPPEFCSHFYINTYHNHIPRNNNNNDNNFDNENK